MRTVVGADLWIDDISVDCESSSARLAAKNALLVSRALLQELKGAGHLPSLKKSYFVCVCVCGSYACEKELRRMLTPEENRIHRIGKDLGVPMPAYPHGDESLKVSGLFAENGPCGKG